MIRHVWVRACGSNTAVMFDRVIAFHVWGKDDARQHDKTKNNKRMAKHHKGIV